ncbi:hypothetical protein RHMOL_Rhmol08G0205900 [Rhododendron molle]|uniref:Uncharacterized protein n=1 Tax=Rhododendron molle TaxID=49168 RepID=A0ACC0MRC2_RHOML|nr:hypothetical protein RHMOL_Rhmol08G0205900 [Rhododendron molle]
MGLREPEKFETSPRGAKNLRRAIGRQKIRDGPLGGEKFEMSLGEVKKFETSPQEATSLGRPKNSRQALGRRKIRDGPSGGRKIRDEPSRGEKFETSPREANGYFRNLGIDNSRLAACVEALEAEMAFYRGEIEELNTQIARLIKTIRSLRRSVQLAGLLLRSTGCQEWPSQCYAPYQAVFSSRNRAEWVDFFRRQRAETISWRCRWLDLPPMTVHYMGPQWVVLAGLGAFTFYIPYRIQRPLSLRQEAPAEVLVDVVLPLFIHSVLCHYQRFWRTREVTDAHPYPSVAVRGSYRKWLRRDIAARAGAQGN